MVTTMVRRLCGHCYSLPSGVVAQSRLRQRPFISPVPANSRVRSSIARRDAEGVGVSVMLWPYKGKGQAPTTTYNGGWLSAAGAGATAAMS